MGKLTKLMKIAVAYLLLAEFIQSALGLRLRQTPKKKPKINWNHSYYSTPFEACKKLRVFDPVEMMRAQAFSADIFRKCVPGIIMRLAPKYGFPAFGVLSLARFECLMINVIFNYMSQDNDLIMPADTESAVFFDLAEWFMAAMNRLKYTVVFTHRRSKFLVNHTMMNDLINEATPCLLHSKKMPQVDGDYYKHAVNHCRIMLL